jgi:enamine deaminase RidA (YjgF/YER057c/UK114 family)
MPEHRKQAINPGTLFYAPGVGFSQAIKVGDTVYCSGQVSEADGLEAQAREAFNNVRTLLDSAGARMADIVKMTIYTTQEDGLAKIRAVRQEFLTAPFPASTLVVVKALADPRYLVEVDVTAVIGSGA